MNVPYVEPTAIVLDARYLCLAHAGPGYTGYIGSLYFDAGRATCPVFGSELTGLINAVHVYPWIEGVSIDWRHQDAPRVFVPEPKPVRATPVAVEPLPSLAEILAPDVAEVASIVTGKTVTAGEVVDAMNTLAEQASVGIAQSPPLKRSPGRPRKVQ